MRAIFISKKYNEITGEICSLLGFNPIFKGDALCYAIKDGADMFFFRNVGTESPVYAV